MKDIAYSKVKKFIEKENSGLHFISPCTPYLLSSWCRNSYKSGFSDTYKVRNGTRHRRKYYMHYGSEANIKALDAYLNDIKQQEAKSNFNYKIEIVWKRSQIIRIVTYYDTEA